MCKCNMYLCVVTGTQAQHTVYTEDTECSYEPYENVLDKVKEMKEPPPEDLVEKEFGRVRCLRMTFYHIDFWAKIYIPNTKLQNFKLLLVLNGFKVLKEKFSCIVMFCMQIGKKIKMYDTK